MAREFIYEANEPVAVRLDIEEYEDMYEELQSLRAYIAHKASGEAPIPWSEVKERLDSTETSDIGEDAGLSTVEDPVETGMLERTRTQGDRI